MANTITTSIVVNFGEDDQGILTAKVDDRPNGYNSGETSFAPGETVGFLVYSTSNVSVNTPIPSLGSVQQITGAQTESQDEFITFENTNKSSSSLPIRSGFTYEWIGTNLGAVTVSDQQTVIAANKGVAVLHITYNTQFVPWRLTNIPTTVAGESSFPVLIFISGTIA